MGQKTITTRNQLVARLFEPKAWLLGAGLLINPLSAARLATQTGRLDPPTRYALAWMAWFAAINCLFLLLYQREATARKLRTHWKSYFLLAVSSLLALCLVELFLTLAGDKLKSRTFHVKNYEFSFQVRLNSQGFRDREFRREKPPEARRILMIGDSFVYGVGVEEKLAIPNRLETQLNRSSQHRYEVFNLGIPGANPTGYADVARQFAGYSPDLVLLVFYVDNDVNLGLHGPVGIRRSGLWRLFERVSNALFAEADYAWARHYDIDPFYREKAVHGEINPLLLVRASSFEDEQAYYENVAKRFNAHPGVGRKLLEIRDTFAGVPFLVVLVPSKYQTSPESIPELEKIGFHFREGRVADNKIQQALQRFFQENDVAFVDLLPAILDSRRQTGRNHYFTLDDHFNELGYQVAADVLAKPVADLLEK